MPRRERSQGEGDPPENRVFSSRSPEELYKLCRRAARKQCKAMGYDREAEDVGNELWLYLHERGHAVKFPEHEGAIVEFLKYRARYILRGKWKHDNSHDSIHDADPEGRPFDRSDDNEAAMKILEDLTLENLIGRVMQDARHEQILKSLAEGATQTEAAERHGVKQYQVSRLLSALRRRIGHRLRGAAFSIGTEKKK